MADVLHLNDGPDGPACGASGFVTTTLAATTCEDCLTAYAATLEHPVPELGPLTKHEFNYLSDRLGPGVNLIVVGAAMNAVLDDRRRAYRRARRA